MWVGYDQPKKLPGLTGSSYPGGIWHEFMEKAHQDLTPLAFLGSTEIMDTNEYEDMDELLSESSEDVLLDQEYKEGEEEWQD